MKIIANLLMESINQLDTKSILPNGEKLKRAYFEDFIKECIESEGKHGLNPEVIYLALKMSVNQ